MCILFRMLLTFITCGLGVILSTPAFAEIVIPNQLICSANTHSHSSFTSLPTSCASLLTDDSMIVWDTEEVDVCNFINESKIHDGIAKMHFETHADANLAKLDIPSLSLTFTEFFQSPQQISSCFPSKSEVLMTIDNFVLFFPTCSPIKQKYPSLGPSSLLAVKDVDSETKISYVTSHQLIPAPSL